MPASLEDPPASPTAEEPASPAAQAYRLTEFAESHERRNFVTLAVYQIVMRIGWIFKTESVVMPAVLDTITGGGPASGVWRGFLPVFNRLGHSIPPLLFSRRLKVLPRKRSALMVCTLGMAAVFAALSCMWVVAAGEVASWMPPLFLACYAVFFIVTGLNNLAFGALQGKLVHATRRGRLMLAANGLGAVFAISAVAILLPQWLSPSGGEFESIFAFTAGCFAVAAGVLWLIREPRDDFSEPPAPVRKMFQAAWRLARQDRKFRRLAGIAMAFSSSLLLFPHYQALGRREPLGLSFDNLMLWLIIQNTGTALFSLIVGPLADRYGNRLVLRLVLFGMTTMPLAAIAAAATPSWGRPLYPGVFLLIGLTPVGFKTLANYTLEICGPEDHSRYLSTLGLCYALPLLLSPAVGLVVESVGFNAVFASVSAIVGAGWAATFAMHEPRNEWSRGHAPRD